MDWRKFTSAAIAALTVTTGAGCLFPSIPNPSIPLDRQEQAAVLADVVTRVREKNSAALYCCDPVIGEVGRGVYVRAGIPEAFQQC